MDPSDAELIPDGAPLFHRDLTLQFPSRDRCISDLLTEIPAGALLPFHDLRLPTIIDGNQFLYQLLREKGIPLCPPGIHTDAERINRLAKFDRCLREKSHRGSLINLCGAKKIYVVGDLHARLDNLAAIISHKELWQEVRYWT